MGNLLITLTPVYSWLAVVKWDNRGNKILSCTKLSILLQGWWKSDTSESCIMIIVGSLNPWLQIVACCKLMAFSYWLPAVIRPPISASEKPSVTDCPSTAPALLEEPVKVLQRRPSKVVPCLQCYYCSVVIKHTTATGGWARTEMLITTWQLWDYVDHKSR